MSKKLRDEIHFNKKFKISSVTKYECLEVSGEEVIRITKLELLFCTFHSECVKIKVTFKGIQIIQILYIFQIVFLAFYYNSRR